MKLQALMLRAGLAATTGVMLSAAAFFNHAPEATIMASAPATIAAVTDREAVAPVVLPTIHVRPSAADIAAARITESDEYRIAVEVALPVDLSEAAARTVHSLNVDMPYYSFGKVLPRISKE
jgi:hypothetical protein